MRGKLPNPYTYELSQYVLIDLTGKEITYYKQTVGNIKYWSTDLLSSLKAKKIIPKEKGMI